MGLDYGFIVTQPRAGQVLNALGITQDTQVDPIDGYHGVVDGKPYWILQADYWMPPSNTRADGIHIVYSPSQEEVDLEESQDIPLDVDEGGLDEWRETLNNLLLVAGLGIAAYVAVNAMGFFKKK